MLYNNQHDIVYYNMEPDYWGGGGGGGQAPHVGLLGGQWPPGPPGSYSTVACSISITCHQMIPICMLLTAPSSDHGNMFHFPDRITVRGYHH